jgi:hypothetical protein
MTAAVQPGLDGGEPGPVAGSVHDRIQLGQQARRAARDRANVAAAAAPPPLYPAQPQQAYAEPALPPPPAAAAQGTGISDRLSQLTQLGELLQAAVLTQAEFDQQKVRILKADPGWHTGRRCGRRASKGGASWRS